MGIRYLRMGSQGCGYGGMVAFYGAGASETLRSPDMGSVEGHRLWCGVEIRGACFQAFPAVKVAFYGRLCWSPVMGKFSHCGFRVSGRPLVSASDIAAISSRDITSTRFIVFICVVE